MQQNLAYSETLLVHPPSDIKIYPELISEAEEQDLLAEIAKLDLKQVHLNGVLARRKSIALQAESPFIAGFTRAAERLPLFLEPILPRVARIMRVKPSEIAEIQITHYPNGAGIGWHHDSDVFGEVLAGITLMSGCRMKFRHEVGSQYEVFKAEVPQRSAYVMAGEARWDWQHTIASHQTPRMAITFRTLVPPGSAPLL